MISMCLQLLGGIRLFVLASGAVLNFTVAEVSVLLGRCQEGVQHVTRCDVCSCSLTAGAQLCETVPLFDTLG